MYTIKVSPGPDAALNLALAMASAPESDIIVRFEPGTYDVAADRAYESLLSISNHGMNKLIRTFLPIVGKKNVSVEGAGARIVTDGYVNPVLVRGSENVAIDGLELTMKRPTNVECEVLSVKPDEVKLRIAPRDIEDLACDRGRLRLRFGGGYIEPISFTTIRFKPDGQIAEGSHDSGVGAPFVETVQSLDGDVLTVRGDLSIPPEVGDTVVFRFGGRFDPAVFILDSERVSVRNVTIREASGMGIIGQTSRDIALDNCVIAPESGKYSSLAADATHFVGCEGELTVRRLTATGQLDDPINVHGIYMRNAGLLAPDTLLLELVHPEQYGVELFHAGDSVGFVDHETLGTFAYGKVAEVRGINVQFSAVRFEEPVPGAMRVHDCVEKQTYQDVLLDSCVFKRSRARGPLLSCRGRAVMRNCELDVTGAGVKISGDCNSWFESGATQDILIEGNSFNLCGRNPGWGGAAITIDPEILPEFRGKASFHKKVAVTGNKFVTGGRPCVTGFAVDELVFECNEFDCPEQDAVKVGNGRSEK